MEKKISEETLKTKLKYLCLGSFLFIAPLTMQNINAQTPVNVNTSVHFGKEDLQQPMTSMMNRIYTIKMTGDFDKDYVAIMNEFQQGGIDLCKIYEMSGEDPKLLENAKISAVELKEDQKILKTFANKEIKTTTTQKEPNDLMQSLNNMMKGVEQVGKTGNLNNDYASIMLMYNWANIEMAKSELHYGHNTALKNRAAGIVEEFSCHESSLTEWLDKIVEK